MLVTRNWRWFGPLAGVLMCFLLGASQLSAQTTIEILDFQPKTGAAGEIIEILGTGFDPDPDNNCAVVMMTDTCSLPLQVLSVEADSLTGLQVMRVQVGPVFQGAQPGPIMVALGQGAFGTFDPILDEVEVVEDVWVWDRIPNGPTADTVALGEAGIFDPIRPPQEQWLHGEPRNGRICLTLSGNWCADQEMSIHVRAHDHTQGIGHDAFFPQMRIRGPGGSAVDCAAAICDMIVCAFFQQSGIVIDCGVEGEPGTNQAKITISLDEGGFIDWGNLDICLLPEKEPPLVGCLETVNPHGKNVPPAGSTTLPGRKGGQNEDGFYELIAADNCSAPDEIAIFVVDSGTGTIFGPFGSGDKIKYTQARGAKPRIKKIGSDKGQAGAIAAHITGKGDAVVFGVDAAGNISDDFDCLVPPPPK